MSRGRRPPGFCPGGSILADNEMQVEAQMLELKQMKEELMLRESQLLRLKSRQQNLEEGLMAKGRGRGVGHASLGMEPDMFDDMGPTPFGMGPNDMGLPFHNAGPGVRGGARPGFGSWNTKRPFYHMEDFSIGSGPKRGRFNDEHSPFPMQPGLFPTKPLNTPRVHTFCDICGIDVIELPWNQHVRSREHKWMENQCRKGCGWCEIETFRSYEDVISHRRTAGHLQNKDKFKYLGNDRDVMKYKTVDELPDYDAEKEIGQNYVAFVTGWYCKLCKKFFREETTANGEHCRSKPHYDKWRAAREMGIQDRLKNLAKKQQL